MTPKTHRIISFLLCMAVVLAAAAQEIKVQAPQTVYQGDMFTVRFSVDDQARDFKGPSFKGFSLRSGPSQSSSTNMTFINGKMSRSVNTTFSYTLVADMEGSYTVGAASCTVGGKQISSKSFTIKVEKMSAAQQQQRQQQQQQQQRQQSFDPWAQQPQSETTIDDKSLFARASVNKQNPYQGEQVIITYKIYTQVPLRQFAIDKLPGNKGFWAEDLSTGQQQVKQYEETIGERRYQVAEIRRGALFAQESGHLTIEPLDLNVLAMVQRQRQRTGTIWDLFDDPFFNAQQAVERPLSTNRININVRPLPEAPDGFSGAVGRFDVSGGLDDNNAKANEAITYRITVNGSGNLMLIDAPSPDFTTAFEVYDPQIDDNLRRTDAGVSGSRTWEWVLIPRNKGEFTIPAFNFIYFDPSTGKYITKTIPEQHVSVARGENQMQSSSRDDVRLLNSDINYIHPTGKLHPTGYGDRASWLFWTIAALMVCLTIVAFVVARRREAEEADIVGTRMKKATRMARRRLKRAEAHLKGGDTNRFYEEVYRAMWGCLADKYGIELSRLSRDSVSACMAEKQVPAERQQSILSLLQEVDIARFAPGDAEAQKQHIYDQAVRVIASL